MISALKQLFGFGPDLDLKGSGEPLVSVIVPTYCRPEMLKEAVQSILAQTLRSLEVVVINDGGPDVSEMLNSLGDSKRIVYIRHEKSRERSAARNTGLAAARGKYIAYLDDDDVFYPTHLEKLVRLLHRTGLKVAYSDAYQARQTLENGRYVITKRKAFRSGRFDREKMLVHNYIPTLCIVHERACLQTTGLFDTSLSTHEDWDMWVRFSQNFEFAHLRRITCEFRVRNDQSNTTTSNRADFLRTAEIIYKRYEDGVKNNPALIQKREQFLNKLRAELAARS